MTSFSDLEKRLASFEDHDLGTGATDEEIAAAEKSLGVAIQGGYRAFLHRFGWGGVEHIVLYGLGSGAPSYLDLVAVTQSERSEMVPPLRPYLIPVRNTGGGDLHCLDTRVSGEPPVVYWSHEDGADQEVEVEAESFAEWLSEQLDYLE